MKNRFGVRLNRMEENFWNFGVELAHMHSETFVTIYIYKLMITIGKFFH